MVLATKASQISGFPFNIYIMTEASDFKFGTHLGFAKAHHNICASAGASNFKFGLHLQFAKAHPKTIPRGKVGVALGYGSSQIFGVPL